MKKETLKSVIGVFTLYFVILFSFQTCDPDVPDKPTVAADSLNVSIATLSFNSYKDAGLVTIRTNVSWSATVSASWLSLSATSGKGNTAFLIGASENPDLQREAKVTITAGDKSKEITITQEGTPRMIVTIAGVNLVLRKVEGSVFSMSGNDNVAYYGIGHYVTLSDFYIMETEVTNQLWEKVMKSLPYDTIAIYAGHDQHNKPLQPVSATNWNDITNKFLPALNQLTGKTFKLPTEAQWEYAARGGKLYQGKKYAGSDKADDVAWYYQNSNAEKHNVGEKNPNETGLYDMSGNVNEWCSDWYDQYFGFTVQNGSVNVPQNSVNPTGPATGTKKIVRGGSFSSEETFGYSDCNVRDRRSVKPNGYDTYEGNPTVYFMSKNTGFRLVISQ